MYQCTKVGPPSLLLFQEEVFFSLIVCLTSDHYTFCNLFKVRLFMGALIMTSVNYMEKVFRLSRGNKPGPSQTGVVCCILLTKALSCFIFYHHLTIRLFAIYLRSDMPLDPLIMTNVRSLLWAAYEVILLHSSSNIYSNVWSLEARESKPRTSWLWVFFRDH